MYNLQERVKELEKTKMHQIDRVLRLKVKDGKKPITSTGLVDPRLFSGENTMHVIMNKWDCMWRFEYEHGMLPPVFNQRFTSFSKAKKFAEEYFNRRNIEISEVKG